MVHGSCPDTIEEVWERHGELEGPTKEKRQVYVKLIAVETAEKLVGDSNLAGSGLNLVKSV
jgi:hypothetical protein